jgi:hypothetical protein
MPGLADFTMAEIYREYQNNRINVNGKTKPYIFFDLYKKEHKPVIIYESDDYLRKFSNWSVYDKLQIQNNIIKYTYCEIWDNTVFITGSLLLGSIYSILVMIGRVFEKQKCNISNKIDIKLTIKGNEKMTFRMQKRIMDIDEYFMEMYYLEKDKEHTIDYSMKCSDGAEINRFTNRFLELFTSENPRSNTPYRCVTLEETSKFGQLLLAYENYLVIDN